MFETKFVKALYDVASDQAPVVQSIDSAARRISHYPLDDSIGFASVFSWIVIYPVDSAIHRLNNWGLVPLIASLRTSEKVIRILVNFSQEQGSQLWLGIRDSPGCHVVLHSRAVHGTAHVPIAVSTHKSCLLNYYLL